MKKRDIIFASGEFLTRRLPARYDTWDEDKLMAFITEHSWDVFAMCEPAYVLELIEGLAESVSLYMKQQTK